MFTAALIAQLILVVPFSLSQQKHAPANHPLSKAGTALSPVLMNANNLTSWVRSDGTFPNLIKESWNGEFPKGSGVGTVYQEGIVFGGKVRDGVYADSIRVNGDTYIIGMQPGSILTDGSGNTIGADNPNDVGVRAFAVRPDMPASIQNDTSSWPILTTDAASYFQKSKDSVTAQHIQQIASQYFKDWLEWPAVKGAPWFVDSVKIVRNDAAYDPMNPHDIPGIPDAAKTIWFVCNDENPLITAQSYGSPPIGVEEQVTLWAFNLSGTFEPLNNVIFKQVKLIFKGNPGAMSNSKVDSMFISQWDDADIGDAGDDYAGCDSLVNLGFVYNSTALDTKYSPLGLMAPADGFALLEGPSRYTGRVNDSAIVNFQWRLGYKNWQERSLSSFMYFGSGLAQSDPDNGSYAGTLQWYNLMRNYQPRPAYPAAYPVYMPSPYPYTYPYTNLTTTKYPVSGDPATGQGWIDGPGVGAGDRQIACNHGSFVLNLHDTAETVIAHVAAIGASNILSVQILKYNLGYAKYWFNGMARPNSVVSSVASKSIPRTFEVSQNYPNPFNPSTTIRYQIPSDGKVAIRIFNLLGQEISTLVNEQKKAGSYSIEWNGSNTPSGVYFYRTELTPVIGNRGSLRDVKKMILLK
jgi:hypothetical protein